MKAQLVTTGLTILNDLSVDAGRLAFISAPTSISIYDTQSATSTSFPWPAGATTFHVMISGSRVVAVAFPSFTASASIYSCVLPNVVPLAACGPWTLVATVDSFPVLAARGFPMLGGDIVVWPTSTGFSYYRFSSGTISSVALPVILPTGGTTKWLSTNGAIIAFAAKSVPASPSVTIMYYDTTASPPAVVDSGLPGLFPSISQYTVAFNDNSTTTPRIRFYDILRNTSSAAGTGPLGTLAPPATSGIWGDRIVFKATESDIAFDCNGDGTISSSEFCLQYWNIRTRPFEQPFLAASAAPALGSSTGSAPLAAIYDKVVAFSGPGGSLQYVIVPMKGDVNLDGKVDIIDIAISGACFAQVIKGPVC